MKNKFSVLCAGTLALLLVFGFGLAGCGGDDDDPSFDPALVGTWDKDDDSGVTLTFTSKGKLTVTGWANPSDDDDEEDSPNSLCSTSGSTLIIPVKVDDKYRGGEVRFTYSVSGSTLTLSGVTLTGDTGDLNVEDIESFNDTYTKR
jgi:hypothetical protein